MSTVRPTKLSVKQKCEIAQRELDDLRKSSKKFQDFSIKIKTT